LGNPVSDCADEPFDIVVAELSADLNAAMERYSEVAAWAGRWALSFSAETASLILPHSYGIVLKATAKAKRGGSGEKLMPVNFCKNRSWGCQAPLTETQLGRSGAVVVQAARRGAKYNRKRNPAADSLQIAHSRIFYAIIGCSCTGACLSAGRARPPAVHTIGES
jgi:hypothetical protein